MFHYHLMKFWGELVLCSKNYLRNGGSLAKIFKVKLQLKFNFKQMLFYASSQKNDSFKDFLLIYQIFEF